MNWFKKILSFSANFDISKKRDKDFDSKQLDLGEKEELEHTNDEEIAKSIAKDHLTEYPDYYIELEKLENKLKKRK
jgi:hypothetical protein